MTVQMQTCVCKIKLDSLEKLCYIADTITINIMERTC